MAASLIGPLGRTVLGPTKVTIGRASDNTLVLNDSRVSSHHAEVRPEGQYYSLVDLGSTNGSFVNEQQVYSEVPRLLQAGDAIRIGDTMFTFEASAEPQSASYSDGSTVQAMPPPPPGAAGFAGNTSYGMGNPGYPGGQPYQATVPAPSTFTPPQQPSETQMPTYIPSSYGQSGQPPSYAQQSRPSYSQPTVPQPDYASPTDQQASYTPPAPVYNPPPAQQKKRSPARAIILAVIALVIILGGLGGFFIIHNNQITQNNNATATAQTNNNATATSQAIAQATVHAIATAHANATALVTSQYAPFTKLALFDPLTSSSSSTAQWDTSSSCQFTGSAYQASTASSHTFQPCFATSTNFQDFAFQVNMVIQKGDCGGLLFRAVDRQDFYVVDVCQDGTYSAAIASKDSFTPNFVTASSIHTGLNQMNTVAVVMSGSTISVYVNNTTQPIFSQPDNNNTYTSGAIGVMADAPNVPTTVTYTDAVVWQSS